MNLHLPLRDAPVTRGLRLLPLLTIPLEDVRSQLNDALATAGLSPSHADSFPLTLPIHGAFAYGLVPWIHRAEPWLRHLDPVHATMLLIHHVTRLGRLPTSLAGRIQTHVSNWETRHATRLPRRKYRSGHTLAAAQEAGYVLKHSPVQTCERHLIPLIRGRRMVINHWSLRALYIAGFVAMQKELFPNEHSIRIGSCMRGDGYRVLRVQHCPACRMALYQWIQDMPRRVGYAFKGPRRYLPMLLESARRIPGKT